MFTTYATVTLLSESKLYSQEIREIFSRVVVTICDCVAFCVTLIYIAVSVS